MRTDTARISDRWLRWVRIAWIALAVFLIGAYLITLPARAAGTQEASISNAGWFGWTEAQTRAAYAQLGWMPEDYTRFWNGPNLVLPLVYFVLALFIFWRRSNDWTALLGSLLFLTFLTTGPFDILASQNPAWSTVSEAFGAATSTLFFLFLAVFPNGRFVPRFMRWLALLEAGIQLWRLYSSVTYQQYAFLLAGPMFLVLPPAQIYRYLRVSSPSERSAIKWVVFGMAAALLPLAIYLTMIFVLLPDSLRQPNAAGVIALFVGGALWNLALVLMPLSFTIAILRSRLWDIDIIIRRTLVYSALTALLALFYFGSVTLLQRALSFVTGPQPDLALVLSTLAMAVLSIPLRNRIQGVIDRRFYRRKYDAQKVLARFAEKARDEVDSDRLTEELVSVVEQAMQPTQISLWVRTRSEGTGNGPHQGTGKAL